MKGIAAPNPLRRHGLPGRVERGFAGPVGSLSPSNSASHEPLVFSRRTGAHGVTDFLDADGGTQARDREQRCESLLSLTHRPPVAGSGRDGDGS
jgi:hypothetical protein